MAVNKADLLLEAERRGLLPPERAAVLKEARARGLVGGVDYDVGESLENLPNSAVQYARDMAQPIMHPLQTAKSLVDLGRGTIEKVIPGKQEHEPAVDAVVKAVIDRYGSMDAFKQTAMADPVGMLGDVSAAMMGVGGLASRVPGVVGRVARTTQKIGGAVEPVNIAANTAKQAARLVPHSLTKSAYDSSVKWRTVIDPAQRNRMTETSLREGLPPSYEGVGRMHGKIRDLTDQLDTLIEGAGDVAIPADVVFRHLDDVKTKVGGFKANAAKDVAVVQSIQDNFADYLKEQNITEVTARQLQDFKTDAYKRINFDLQQGKANYAGNEATKGMARAAKEGIEAVSPEVAEINKKLGELLELAPELERAAGRVENKNIIGISEPIMIGAGAALGGGSDAAKVAGAVGGGAVGAVKRKSAEIAVYIEKVRQQGVPESYIQNRLMPAMLRDAANEIGRLTSGQEPENEKVGKQPDSARKYQANFLKQPNR